MPLVAQEIKFIILRVKNDFFDVIDLEQLIDICLLSCLMVIPNCILLVTYHKLKLVGCCDEEVWLIF
jgi:hypothetical protein